MAPNTGSAQDFVPVQEVRNGVIILKDGTYRSILMCSSLNFALKSEDEQKAIIGGFQSFLNSLDFSIQIVVQSRKMDIRPYLTLLSEQMNLQRSELMRIQLREYTSFIENFISGNEIMTKVFYIVIPYGGGGTALPALSDSLSVFSQKKPSSTGFSQNFEQDSIQLGQRVSLVEGGIGACGLKAVRLETEEIIELLYRAFNPGEFENPIKTT